MAKEDVTLALGVLNTIASGLTAAHASDVNMRIATLQDNLNKSKIEAETTRQNLIFADNSMKEEKNNYFQSLASLDKFNIPAEQITSAGTEIIQRTFDGKKANLDAIMANADIWRDRYRNVKTVENDLKQQFDDYTEYEAGFSGISGILNPSEFDRFKDFANTEDNPETEEIEGLGYKSKYPNIGTAGMDYQYKQLGTRSQIRISEDTALKNKLSEEKLNFDKDYTVMKSVFTVEHEEGDNEKKKLKNTEKAAERMGLDLKSFQTMQGLFSTTSGEDALSQLYSIPNSQDAINVLRQNSSTSFIMENLEKRYEKILDINLERSGDIATTATDYTVNLLDRVNNSPNIDQALYVYTQAINQGVTYDTANQIMTAISSNYNISVSDLEEKWNNTYKGSSSGQALYNNVDSNDNILALFTEGSTPNDNKDEFVTLKRSDNKITSSIDAGTIFDILDNFEVPGTNKYEIENFFQNLLDKDSKSYDPDKAKIYANALNSRTLMSFDDTPATNSMYKRSGTMGAIGEGILGATGLASGNLFDLPSFEAGDVAGEVPLSGMLQGFGLGGGSAWLKDSDGNDILDENNNKILALDYWKGEDQQGWTLGNALGLSKLNPSGESAYMDSYNNSMEESWNKLIDTVDAPGPDVLQKSQWFMNEQNVGAYIKANFGQEAYNRADSLAKEAGRTDQIGEIKKILNKPGSAKYIALLGMLNDIQEYNSSGTTLDETLSYRDADNEKILNSLYFDTNLVPTAGLNNEVYDSSIEDERLSNMDIDPRINPRFNTVNVRRDYDILLDEWNDNKDFYINEMDVPDFESFYNFKSQISLFNEYGGLSYEETLK